MSTDDTIILVPCGCCGCRAVECPSQDGKPCDSDEVTWIDLLDSEGDGPIHGYDY